MILVKAFFDHLDYDLAVEAVSDGIEALDYVNQRPPYANKPRADLILVDVKMPRLDGFGFLEAIGQSDYAAKHIKAVMWTTSSSDSDRSRSLELGAEDFITKPAKPSEVEQALDTIARALHSGVTAV